MGVAREAQLEGERGEVVASRDHIERARQSEPQVVAV
jgi:hypothetical protein